MWRVLGDARAGDEAEAEAEAHHKVDRLHDASPLTQVVLCALQALLEPTAPTAKERERERERGREGED